jgi:hypothetical protein
MAYSEYLAWEAVTSVQAPFKTSTVIVTVDPERLVSPICEREHLPHRSGGGFWRAMSKEFVGGCDQHWIDV